MAIAVNIPGGTFFLGMPLPSPAPKYPSIEAMDRTYTVIHKINREVVLIILVRCDNASVAELKAISRARTHYGVNQQVFRATYYVQEITDTLTLRE